MYHPLSPEHQLQLVTLKTAAGYIPSYTILEVPSMPAFKQLWKQLLKSKLPNSQ